VKVHINDSWSMWQYEVYLYRDIEGVGSYFQQPDGTEILIKHYEMIQGIKPTFMLDRDTAPNLIEALQKSGVQPKQLTLVEGKYQAQSDHLKDLQQILRKQNVM
jgi:hypothetical protein